MPECEETDCKLSTSQHTHQQCRSKGNLVAKKLAADTEFCKVVDNE